jgi:hypothetical protein
MYKADLGHKLCLEDVELGIKLSEGKIVKRVIETKHFKNYLRVRVKASSTADIHLIDFYEDGRIISENRSRVYIGIKLLNEIGIVLPLYSPPQF